MAIRLQSPDFDTMVFLAGPNGLLVASNDQCPQDGNNSCIPANAVNNGVIPLPRTGTYTIEVTSYFEQATGSYTLTVTEEP